MQKITVEVYVPNPYDNVLEHWRIEWNRGSNIAHIYLLQPAMEWQTEVDIPPFAPLAGAFQTLERLVRNQAAALNA